MKYFSILLLFIATFGFSQNREYHFDYLLEYKITFHKQNFTESKYYLTNSKNNSYLGLMKETDSLHFELILRHHGEIYSKVKLLKSDFFKAETINIDCKNVILLTNTKIKLKDKVSESLHDTLIDGTSYFVYKLELKEKPRNKKRHKGLVTKYYIINKTTSFHLPLLEDIYDYKLWMLNKYMPNGIYNQQIQINLLNQPHASEILQSYYEMDKKISIIGECPETIK